MEKFIPYEKLSKKKKRELNAGKRTVWAISPVTRKSENPKAYNRKKAQKWTKDSSFCAFFHIHQLHFWLFSCHLRFLHLPHRLQPLQVSLIPQFPHFEPKYGL